MAVDLVSAIEASKDIMRSSDSKLANRSSFSRFDRCYMGTTENIREYLSSNFFNKRKALSVLSSGDHVFNLISMGVKDIDTFDINELTYFTFYLRRALMLRFASKDAFVTAQSEFLSMDSFRNIYMMLSSLREFMPSDVYCYYEELMKFNMHLTSGVSTLFYKLYRNSRICYDYNLYMEDEKTFRDLLDKLNTAKVSFSPGDIRVIRDNLGNGYDIILFSNIADYNYSLHNLPGTIAFKMFLASFANYLAPNGVMINYLMGNDIDGLIDFNLPFSEFGCNFEEKLNQIDYDKSVDCYHLVRKK